MKREKKLKRFHWLASVINEHDYAVGAEVGAATGHTTGYLLQNCPTLEQLIVVDIWERIPGSSNWDIPNMKNIFIKRFGHYTIKKWEGDKPKLQILEGISWEMADAIRDDSLDFVFIDASHEPQHVKWDLKAWIPKVKKTGILCGHDLHFPGVQQALAEAPFPFEIAGIDNCWYVNGDRL